MKILSTEFLALKKLHITVMKPTHLLIMKNPSLVTSMKMKPCLKTLKKLKIMMISRWWPSD